MLTREAWNALLKILEEPPPRVVFVFATTEPHKIQQSAAPVLSRLQRFDLRRIGTAEIISRLIYVLGAEGVASSPEAIAMIARAADGSMRDALSLADQVISISGSVTPESIRDALGLVPEDEFIGILDLIAERRAGDVFPLVTRLAEAGVDFAVFLSGLADVIRAQLALVLGGAAEDASPALREALMARAPKFTAADLLRMLNAITNVEPALRKSGQQQLLIEMLLVRFALLERSVSIEDLLRSLAGDGGSAAAEHGSSAPAPPAPPAPVSSPPPRSLAQEPRRRGAEAKVGPATGELPSGAGAATGPAGGGESGIRGAAPDVERWEADASSGRITPEALREERVESIRRRSPFMDAAIDALDLELME